jgi:hypothetical protein
MVPFVPKKVLWLREEGVIWQQNTYHCIAQRFYGKKSSIAS